jgi:hypothetical protein
MTELEIEVSEDILVEADRYSIDANIDEGLMRISFLNEEGVLSTMTTNSDGAYAFAHQVLRGYDKLEGL